MPGAIVIKQIKPARLRVDRMRLALLNGMRRTADGMVKDFQATTEHWEHEVEFERSISEALGGPSVSVVTNDEIYRYVNDGTRPHDIWAGWYTGRSEHKSLAFPSAFTSKTKPGSIKSGKGSKGDVDTFTPYVQHPGTKARHFDEQIAEKWAPRFKREMEKAMKEAAKATGHGV